MSDDKPFAQLILDAKDAMSAAGGRKVSLNHIAGLAKVAPAKLRKAVYVKPRLTRAECNSVEDVLGLAPDSLWRALLREEAFLDPEIRRYYEETGGATWPQIPVSPPEATRSDDRPVLTLRDTIAGLDLDTGLVALRLDVGGDRVEVLLMEPEALARQLMAAAEGARVYGERRHREGRE